MFRRFLLKIIIGAAALWAADALLAGFAVSGGFEGYLVAGFILAVLNTFVRPVLKLLSLPLLLVTLGLFTVVINAAILWLASDLSGVVTIAGPGTLLGATLIVSLVYIVLDRVFHH